jgi:tetratricopeptide (TPR) repeat protein
MKCFKHFIIFYFALFYLCFFGVAEGEEWDKTVQYESCLNLAKNNPQKGYDEALKWFSLGGHVASRHCMAIAMLSLGYTEDSASLLEALEGDIKKEHFHLRSQILGQAGQAWLLAGQLKQATLVLNKAIALYPSDPQLYMDRAVARIERLQYSQALNDLNQAIALDLNFGDAYLYRASVKRYINDLHGALGDIDRVLELVPMLPAAVLERGIIKNSIGDFAGGRRDLEQVIIDVPISNEADIARARLNKLNKIINAR